MTKNWNIQGVFTSQKFENIEELQKTFKFKKANLETTISIERGLTQYFERRHFAVIHCENGTVILHDDVATDDDLLIKLSKDNPILSCYVNSMTDTYCFDFFKEEKNIRSLWKSNAQPAINQEKGEKLEWESSKKSIEVIFAGIQNILGENILEKEYDVEWYLQSK
ncbi:MAG: hypothetical protein GY827_00730 [Cytophagales bacterium]|nr:hypothetical protein [Cytophagales bacterium]